VRGELMLLEGVAEADISLGVRDFTITYNPDMVSKEAIQAALDRSGYVCGPTD